MPQRNPVWLEVAVNGPWGRARQPGIPIRVSEIVEEGIACAKAGAAIVHVHAYDEETGQQRDDASLYAEIIEGICAQVDVIVYPTIPLLSDTQPGAFASPKTRFAAVEELAKSGLLEWAVVDPGSTNFERISDLQQGRLGSVYVNSPADIAEGLTLAETYAFHPSYAIYEPGFLRLGAALARLRPRMPDPIFRFMFSNEFTFGFPPSEYALDAYLRLLREEAPGAHWMVAGLGVDISPLIPVAVKCGGHVRVGLEDAPFGIGRTNLEMVEEAAQTIVSAGGRLATAADVRQALHSKAHGAQG